MQCLCRALSCWTKGSDAVSVLGGVQAVADCERTAATDRCAKLRDNTIEEIITEYERICPPHCPDPAGEDEHDEDRYEERERRERDERGERDEREDRSERRERDEREDSDEREEGSRREPRGYDTRPRRG